MTYLLVIVFSSFVLYYFHQHFSLILFYFLQPSSIPLSKNYAEMRERLRLQLKKKVSYCCTDH